MSDVKTLLSLRKEREIAPDVANALADVVKQLAPRSPGSQVLVINYNSLFWDGQPVVFLMDCGSEVIPMNETTTFSEGRLYTGAGQVVPVWGVNTEVNGVVFRTRVECRDWLTLRDDWRMRFGEPKVGPRITEARQV